MTQIRTLFANKIDRRIEEVIKVDQTDEEIIRDEIGEYVVTDAIRAHFTAALEAYAAARTKKTEGIAIWVSGFFGSGKSSFAKMLGLAIEDRTVVGESAAERFAEQTGDTKLKVLLKGINENIPTHAVIFDVSTDRGIKSGNQTLTEIMYGLFLQSLGYAKNLDLSELEIDLEDKGTLAAFEAEYERVFRKKWSHEKGRTGFAMLEASRVLHNLDPLTYPAADSWAKVAMNKADISPHKLAVRIGQLMQRRKPGHSVLFVVDEVGQFVARDLQKMLDLQAIVQMLGVHGHAKHWLVVTSQEKLGEVVSGLDDKRIELARLMDRFAVQVHLEPSDISEVTSRRVLKKNASAQESLGRLYQDHRARLADHTRLSADIKLPDLTRESFIDLYPLLPYQIDLIIQVVSGLRTQGGAGKHVGGANRTIIKLAQQLLINPAVNLADDQLGRLVRLDQVYDLVDGNIGSEVRAKITGIARELRHPLAQPVAKVICLLQYVKSVHRSVENIAAALQGSVADDSQLSQVKDAIVELESAHKVRRGDDGYRIPTPAEDDWERVRNGIGATRGDFNRIYHEFLLTFWQPQPSHMLSDTKAFKGGLALNGREVSPGDMTFHVHLAQDAASFDELAAELRTRSQQERMHVFWAIPLNAAVSREAEELHRSREILLRKERETKGEDTPALLAEERVRLRRHGDELRRLLKVAALSGRISFRGKDRSPGERAVDVGKVASDVLGDVLPDVFDRFKEAAAKVADVRKGTEALFTAENLQALPSVFGALGLLRDEKGKTVFRTQSGPLKEVLDRIEERASYGNLASGTSLASELGKEPFGWDQEVVRLLVVALLRAGAIEATSKGQTIDIVTSTAARDTFANNNLFKQASFRPKKGIDHEELLHATDAFRETFGSEVKEVSAAVIVSELRRQLAGVEDTLASGLAMLAAHRLPGASPLEVAVGQMKAIARGSDDNAIATFNASHRTLKDAIKRGRELEQSLNEARLHDLERAREARGRLWSVLSQENDLPEALRTRAAELEDLLQRETFFKELPAIEQHTKAIEVEHQRREREALSARVEAYAQALSTLAKTPGWDELDEHHQRRLAEPFERGRDPAVTGVPIAQLRADRDACGGRLSAAILELRRTLDGERAVTVSLASFFAGGIETEEQLEAALSGVRDACARLIGAGKKVLVQ